MSEWKTIDSAPKDGSEYLAINDRGHYSVCHWDEMKWAHAGSEPCVFPLDDATHWHPLPAPPKEEL